MTDLSADFQALAQYRPTHKVRFVTAASLFDGHDAANRGYQAPGRRLQDDNLTRWARVYTDSSF